LPIGPDRGASSGNHEAANRNAPRDVSHGVTIIVFLEAIMAIGTVKWFNAQKGFGFIQPESGGKDVFVHISAVERAGLNGLNEGQKISYEVQEERGKQSAGNLKA
jgi:CspA family cold shock protein